MKSYPLVRFPFLFVLGLLLALAFPVLAQACSCGPGCKCGEGCQCGGPSGGGSSSGAASTELQIRKNQADLTSLEKKNFVNAVLDLKKTFREGSEISIYDEFVQIHRDALRDGAIHEGPAFFPWHRQFLRNFELELQNINPNVTIPYWDFTVDNSPDSSIWDKNFMGGNGDPADNYAVKTGPFQQGEWILAFDGPDLRRNFGGIADAYSLPTAEQVAASLGIGAYDASPWDITSDVNESFRNHVTGWSHSSGEPELHNRVHLWVGGSLGADTSPNDPVFWLLHAFLDKLWADWQAIHGEEYLPEFGAVEGHNLNDLMPPFGVTPASVLRHADLGYTYDTYATSAAAAGTGTPTISNPEPSTLVLLATGAAALVGYGWRRRSRLSHRVT